MFKHIVFLSLIFFPIIISAQRVWEVNLYDSLSDPIEKKKEQVWFDPAMDTLVRNIVNPSLTVFLPSSKKKPKIGVIICPGGGYHVELIEREGNRVARAFNEKGIAAFVLKYRLPSMKSGEDKPLATIQDAQRALELVRKMNRKWGMRIKKLGIMGFSAGGHLAAFTGTHYQYNFINARRTSVLRPDFMLLINPVISFTDSIGHTGSRTNFIGSSPSGERIRFYSSEFFVNKSTPPTYLNHAKDDVVVPVKNSLVFQRELEKYNIPNRLTLFEQGGHGYLKEPAFDRWFSDCYNWIGDTFRKWL